MDRHLGFDRPFITNPSPEQIREQGDQAMLVLARKSIELVTAYLKCVENAVESTVAQHGAGDALYHLENASASISVALAECDYVEPAEPPQN